MVVHSRLAPEPAADSMGASFFHGANIGAVQGGHYVQAQGNANFSATSMYVNTKGPEDPVSNLCQKIISMLREYVKSNFRDIHQDVVDQRAPNTGEKFKKSQTVDDWLKTNESVLWASGGPGAGKTYLASALIELLEDLVEQHPGMAVASAYLRYTEHLTLWDILIALVLHLVESSPLPSVLNIVDKAFQRHQRKNTRPSVQDLEKLLQAIVKEYVQAFLAIDGLDEMPVDIQSALIRVLSSLKANILITSRPLRLLQEKLDQIAQSKPVYINIVAEDEDLEIFIAHMIDLTPALAHLLETNGMQEEVVSKIKKNADGMFLHAALQVRALQECLNVKEIRQEIESFPLEIRGLYSGTLVRIGKQPPRAAALAKLSLLWLIYAQRPLGIVELQHAVAVDPDTGNFDPDRMVPEEHLLGICSGLISLNKETRQVRLVHLTARDSLHELLSESFPNPHDIIAKTCLARLTECGIQQCSIRLISRIEAAFTQHPLLEYAYYTTFYHIQKGIRTSDLLRLLVEEYIRNVDLMPIAMHLSSESPIPWETTRFTPLHVAARFNMPELVLALLREGANINALSVGHARNTSLYWACSDGHQETVDVLIAFPGVDRWWPENEFGQSAWSVAAARGHESIARRFMEMPDFLVNDHNSRKRPAILQAYSPNNPTIIQTFLKQPGVDVNLRDETGRTLLLDAATRGDEVVVELLLAFRGIDVNILDMHQTSPLFAAVAGGYENIVRRLLASPRINVNLRNRDGETPRMLATQKGYETISRMLAMAEFNSVTTEIDSDQVDIDALSGLTLEEIDKLFADPNAWMSYYDI